MALLASAEIAAVAVAVGRPLPARGDRGAGGRLRAGDEPARRPAGDRRRRGAVRRSLRHRRDFAAALRRLGDDEELRRDLQGRGRGRGRRRRWIFGSRRRGSTRCGRGCSAKASLFARERPCYRMLRPRRGIAQPGSAEVLGTSGRRFESCCPDQSNLANANWAAVQAFRYSEKHLTLTRFLRHIGYVDGRAPRAARVVNTLTMRLPAASRRRRACACRRFREARPLPILTGVHLLPATGEFAYDTQAYLGQRATEPALSAINTYSGAGAENRLLSRARSVGESASGMHDGVAGVRLVLRRDYGGCGAGLSDDDLYRRDVPEERRRGVMSGGAPG